MNRGRRSESIFHQNQDYLIFFGLLKQSKELWNIKIAAYCLMTNHYHLLIQTPDANISRVMRHINSIYTQQFNKAHGFDGSIFRGRYKSVLVVMTLIYWNLSGTFTGQHGGVVDKLYKINVPSPHN